MQIHIRKATAQDCPAIMQLVQELAVYEKEPHAVTVTMEHFIESGFGENPVWEAFVATSPLPSPRGGEGDIVGFALYYTRYSTWKGQRMYLEDLLVTDAMRGKGVGKLLFDTLIEECKAKKYSGLVWQVLDWNEPAINFYKKYDAIKFDGEWLNCSMEIK
jgi:GNAT superfamily N-acetyltransferase